MCKRYAKLNFAGITDYSKEDNTATIMLNNDKIQS
jgi:hypothetical protein